MRNSNYDKRWFLLVGIGLFLAVLSSIGYFYQSNQIGRDLQIVIVICGIAQAAMGIRGIATRRPYSRN